MKPITSHPAGTDDPLKDSVQPNGFQREPALPPLLFRAAQAAAYCGVSEATWWRWDAAGRMPRGRKVSAGVQLGSRLDVEQWVTLACPPRAECEARQSAQLNGRR